MKKFILSLLVCAFSFMPGFIGAQEISAAGGSTYAMPFLAIDISPRNLAMGGVAAAVSPDAYAHFGNVAAVSFSDSFMDVGVSYCLRQPSWQLSNSAVAASSFRVGKKLGLTFGVLSDIGRAYGITDENGMVGGTFVPVDIRAGAGVSYMVADFMSVGAAVNYAGSRLSGISGSSGASDAVFADVQVLFKVKDFTFSLKGSNLGMPVKSVSGMSHWLPMNGSAGAGYCASFGRHSISAGLEAGLFFGGRAAFAGGIGAEYVFSDIIALRTGYHYGSERSPAPSFASVGAGCKFKGLRLDLAWLIAGCAMRNTISAGVGYSF
ncbi:MAG: PorV/PorQ family protein [Bacteroidales bacterium]|nr:PorV/PorQ family protein [Bacteroidales bacterium]